MRLQTMSSEGELTDQNPLAADSMTGRFTTGEAAVAKQSANCRAAIRSSSGTSPLDKVQSGPKKVGWFSRLEKRLWGYIGSVLDGNSQPVHSVSGIQSNSRVVEGNIDRGNEDPSVGSHVARGHMDGRSGGMVSHMDLGRNRDSSICLLYTSPSPRD